jgi:outer membrane murein-binding lipoprotein Lpp
MRLLLGVVMVAGCVQAGTSSKRWPNHRKVRDQQVEQIESRTVLLEQRVDELTRELASAKAALAKLQASPAPAGSPAAASPTAELPESGGATQ